MYMSFREHSNSLDDEEVLHSFLRVSAAMEIALLRFSLGQQGRAKVVWLHFLSVNCPAMVWKKRISKAAAKFAANF